MSRLDRKPEVLEPGRPSPQPEVGPRAGGRLWQVLYSGLLEAGLAAQAPLGLAWRLAGGDLGHLRQRRGRLPAKSLEQFKGRRAIWVHAASAGETAAVWPLLGRLQAALPGHPVLFTVTSPYGLAMARRQRGAQVAGIEFAPLDLPRYCRRLLEQTRPVLYLAVEKDLWPNMVRLAKRQGARVVMVSGQAGQRAFPRRFWRATLDHVDRFLMQTPLDARHIISRGAVPQKVQVLGDLKMDAQVPLLSPPEREGLRKEWGFASTACILVAGSVEREDEGPVLEALASLRREGLKLCAVVAPRRLDRVAKIERRCSGLGLPAVRRTAGGTAPVLILDSMGELARVYNLAQVAYVGGGFTPPGGLHNLAEPLACGVPVVFGPLHGQAWRLAGEVAREGAGLEIRTSAGLTPTLARILKEPGLRPRLVAAGMALMEPHRGAAVRYLESILALLKA